MKLIYGYKTPEGTIKVIQTILNQGTVELCQSLKTKNSKLQQYKTYKLMILTKSGLEYNYKFKY